MSAIIIRNLARSTIKLPHIGPKNIRLVSSETKSHRFSFNHQVDNPDKVENNDPIEKVKVKETVTNNIINESQENKKNPQVLNPKMQDMIDKNYGLKKFINRVYGYTGAGIAGSLALTQVLPYLCDTNNLGLYGSGVLLMFGSIMGLSMGKKTKHTIQEIINGKNYTTKYTEHSILRKLSYGGLVTGTGIIMTPLAVICASIDPLIIPKALVATSAVTLGAMYYTLNKRQGELNSWGAPLYGALTGFVGLGLLSLSSQLIYGHNTFSEIWYNIDTYAGIPLFAGLIAYDTSKAIEKYEEDPDEINAATEIYLDFINVLIRMMSIMAKSNEKKH